MRIFYDVDTQNDFMNRGGALYVPDAELIKPNLARLTYYAKRNPIPILGSVDRHFEYELTTSPEFLPKPDGAGFPAHCMDGTEGQKKIPETTVSGIVYIEAGRVGKKALVAKLRVPQLIFEKQHYDVFANVGGNANIERVIELGVKKVILYGVATDYCVRAAALGMRERGIEVVVVEDAIKGVNPETTESALEEMVKAGAKFVKTGEVIG